MVVVEDTDYSLRMAMFWAVQFEDAGDGDDPLLKALKKLVVMFPTKSVTCFCATISVSFPLEPWPDLEQAAVDPVVKAPRAVRAEIDATLMFSCGRAKTP